MKDVYTLLDLYGIPRKSKGYQLVARAVADTVRDPTTAYHIMKWQRTVAKEIKETAYNIDRCMRYAVSKANKKFTLCEFIIECSIELQKEKR